MSASLHWIDFAPSDRERMQRTLALFTENETRDELGLGTIRDAFSDALFPGTSTIQTRLKYFLFVPWHYLQEEHRGTTGADHRRAIDRAERRLIGALKDTDEPGVFGRTSGDALKRLPSSVYWAGLRRWNILRVNVSNEEYPEVIASLRARAATDPQPDDEGISPDSHAIWHERLPPIPEGFPPQADLALTRAEAEYLQGRITTACEGTLLAWLANHDEPIAGRDFPWQLRAAAEARPPHIRDVVDLGRRFSFLMHGAALLYNLMLAEERKDAERQEEYRSLLDQWTADDEAADLATFNCEELWRFTDQARGRVSPMTRQFVERWVEAVQKAEKHDVRDVPAARALVRQQEQRLKGGRSRFINKRALDQWGGASGTARLNYRWTTTRGLLVDLYRGLGWNAGFNDDDGGEDAGAE